MVVMAVKGLSTHMQGVHVYDVSECSHTHVVCTEMHIQVG